jgi:2-keto-4-pentenoate hydratase/2-oxohepta-3-ene-1,7-dioic acid hydratase in catechol pathway
MTGAPGTAVAVQPGDHVEIMVERIGSLTNRIS